MLKVSSQAITLFFFFNTNEENEKKKNKNNIPHTCKPLVNKQMKVDDIIKQMKTHTNTQGSTLTFQLTSVVPSDNLD